MDNQKPTISKLAGLRTLSSDRDGTSHTAEPISLQKSIENDSEIQEAIKKRSTDSVAPKINNSTPTSKSNKKIIQENIVASNPSSSVPPPPAPPKAKAVTIENGDEEAATIITDTKKDRFNLFPAMVDSVKSWFEAKKIAREAKKAPKYTVPETTRRKGIIQKATSQTGKITSSDYETLQDRIRQRQNNEIPTPPPTSPASQEIKETKETKPTTIWTPKTDPAFLMIEEETEPQKTETPNTKPSTPLTNPEPKEIPVLAKKPEVPSEDIIDTPPTPPQTRIAGEPTWETASQDTEKEPLTPEDKKDDHSKTIITPLNTPPSVNTKRDINNDEARLNQKPKPLQRRVQANKPKENQNVLLRTNTNLLSFGISIFFLVLIIVVVGVLVWKNNVNQNPILNPADYPRIVSDVEVNLLYQPITSRKDFIDRIITEYKNDQFTISQFAFTSSEEKRNLIKPSALLNYLDINLETNFNRSITHLYFGGIQFTDPFMALKVTDNVASIGGMLVWEKTLEKDLTDIFQLTPAEVTDSLDGNNPTFMDAMISGKDVRVLRDSKGSERIVYGFIDSNTIVITKSSEAFGKLQALTN